MPINESCISALIGTRLHFLFVFKEFPSFFMDLSGVLYVLNVFIMECSFMTVRRSVLLNVT
jgi:hypothetical protein